MLLNFMLPVLTYGSGTMMDYRELVFRYMRQHGFFETPISNFEVYVNGKYVGETNIDKSNTSFAEDNYAELEHSGIKVKLGDKITLKDKSIVGSGSKLSSYDLQVGKGIVNNVSTAFDSYASINQTITADMVGDLVIFLNVTDNYNKIPRFVNSSQYGNWRSEYLKPVAGSDIQIKGWYFTALKLTVEEFSNPLAEFEIHYEGKDETDNVNDPIELESYPATVGLNDKSIAGKGSIKTWEWERQTSDNNWVPIGSSQNLNVPINKNKETFRLRVENTDGVWSEWVKHTIYSMLEKDDDSFIDESIDKDFIEPGPIIYDKLTSPILAIKWDKVPINTGGSSTVTGKIQRDKYVTWNEYTYTVTSWYPNEKTGKVVKRDTIKNVGFDKDMFLKGSRDWYTDPKPKYTVPSKAKPGTVLVVKLDVNKRVDESRYFPSGPTLMKNPPATYYREWKQVHDIRSSYLEKKDGNPQIVPVGHYNYQSLASAHSRLNSFVNSHKKRYVSVEGGGRRVYWFSNKQVNAKAESKSVVVHSAVDKGPGGIGPGIIIPD